MIQRQLQTKTQTDIDLLNEPQFLHRYYFVLKLVSLKKNKRKQKLSKKPVQSIISHFKFLIQQDDYIIDQTTQSIPNILTGNNIQTSMSLNDKLLNFYINKIDDNQKNTDFQLKMYLITTQQVTEVGSMYISTLTYLEIFLQDGKTIFKETSSISQDYTLQYHIYLEKDQISLQNLLRNNQGENTHWKNAFKRKGSQIIEIDQDRARVMKRVDSMVQLTMKKAIQVDRKKLKQIYSKRHLSNNKDQETKSNYSFLNKIGNIIKSRVSLGTNQKSFDEKSNNKSQKSFVVKAPLIGPHKYNQPQNRSFYHNLERQRSKQKQRVNLYLNKPQLKSKKQHQSIKTFKGLIILLIFIVLMYFLIMPTKRKASRQSDSWFL